MVEGRDDTRKHTYHPCLQAFRLADWRLRDTVRTYITSSQSKTGGSTLESGPFGTWRRLIARQGRRPHGDSGRHGCVEQVNGRLKSFATPCHTLFLRYPTS